MFQETRVRAVSDRGPGLRRDEELLGIVEDEHPPDDSAANPADEASIDSAREEDLDALLAEASELATEVSEEVGLSEDPPPTETMRALATSSDIAEEPSSATPGQDDPTPTDDVDAQLAKVDDLLCDTADQIGPGSGESVESSDMEGSTKAATASGEGPDAPQDPSDKAESADAAEVPAFMDEFVQPTADERSEADLPGDSSNAAAQESVQPNRPAGLDAPTNAGANRGSAKIGLVTSMPVCPDGVVRSSDATPTPPIAEAISNDSSVDVDPDPSDKATKVALVPRIAVRLTPAAMNACERGVGLLERLDAPVRWLGAGTRRVIGWVALATLGTSVIALILSLF